MFCGFWTKNTEELKRKTVAIYCSMPFLQSLVAVVYLTSEKEKAIDICAQQPIMFRLQLSTVVCVSGCQL